MMFGINKTSKKLQVCFAKSNQTWENSQAMNQAYNSTRAPAQTKIQNR